MKTTLKNSFALLCLFFIVLLSSCGVASPRHERVLGTICFVNLYEKGTEKLYDTIFDRLNQLDDEFNLHKPDSCISKINSGAFESPVVVSDDVFIVLQTAQIVAALSNGVYDATIQSVAQLWGISTEHPRVPEREEIKNALQYVDYNNIILNSSDKSVKFAKEGVCVDLGSIVKGYAADEIAKICKENRVKRAVIDLGGNVFVYGAKKDDKPWRIGVKDPEQPQSSPLVAILTSQSSVVTSGAYERFFEQDGITYHHILSTTDGYPVENEMLSVTVVCESSMLADAFSTAFFALGFEQSKKLLPKFEKQFQVPVGLIVVKDDHSIWMSESVRDNCSLLREDWTIEE